MEDNDHFPLGQSEFQERLHSTFVYADGWFRIDNRKFVLLIYDLTKYIQDNGKKEKYFEYYGRILNSLKSINRLIRGKFDLTNSFLHEINPIAIKSSSTEIEKNYHTEAKRLCNLPAGLPPLGR